MSGETSHERMLAHALEQIEKDNPVLHQKIKNLD